MVSSLKKEKDPAKKITNNTTLITIPLTVCV
jgi:hypothetical protein